MVPVNLIDVFTNFDVKFCGKCGKQKGRNAIYFLRKTSRDSTERNEEEKKKKTGSL